MTNQEAIKILKANYPTPNYSELCEAVDMAIAILREQKPVKPNTSCDGLPGEGGTWWYVCGNCNKDIDPDDAYCRHCGRQVKWDG